MEGLKVSREKCRYLEKPTSYDYLKAAFMLPRSSNQPPIPGKQDIENILICKNQLRELSF